MQQHFQLNEARVCATGPLAGLFHPAVADWFTDTFGTPTAAQRGAWQATAQRRNALIAAPTGSGKTLAAFLSAINDLVVEGVERGLREEVHVLYVSPLKALSNDIQKNLEAPLAGIAKRVREMGLAELAIRTAVRTGDTSAIERARMKTAPPHILVTTPESLFILLSSDSGRAMLASTRSVIVDELHAVAGSKRGAHLALSLERLDAICTRPPVRIGLSATQKPIETMAQLLVGARPEGCEIVDAGHVRHRDIALEIPRSPLTAVLATEVWSEIYDRIAELALEHRTTLIFVNQRRQSERVARALAERLGEEHVTAHHGSLAKEHRLRAEQRLKAGTLKALVATASLELGIDIGDVDLVCQIGSPRSINAFLQRVGRSGHAVRATPKGRLFPQSLDDLLECTALIDCVARGELDRVALMQQPLDVLAQQIVAEVACREWGVEELHALFCRAAPYRKLALARFEEIVQMLGDGYSTRRGRRGALLHYDAVNRRMRGRRGAKLTVVTNAGVIPDQFDYEVNLAADGMRIGTLNEDFAFESLPGDIVQLGNTSYRILKVETARVLVEDAKGQPPTMPFWLGEGLGRTDELSLAVSRLRARADEILTPSPHGSGERVGERGGGKEHEVEVAEPSLSACINWLEKDYGLARASAFQLATYLGAAKTALGVLPTRERIVFERFFDEVGDTHLVIHAPLGSRVNRAWGLALRKRFCRQFNFELQAAALDDSLVLSLGPTHSFPLDDVKRFLNSATALEVLKQAVLQAPMFGTRWRWVSSVALAVARNRGGKRMPPQFQRADAEDLLTHAFPDALACQDNLPGDRELPDHPLIAQTMDDCLHEIMDAEGMLALLRRIESGAVEIVCRDLVAPSPLSASILSAKPYAFLDDGAAEERRTRSVSMGSALEPRNAGDLGRLDPAAIERVREEMQPDATNEDELHDALVVNGFLTLEEALRVGNREWLDHLVSDRRVAFTTPDSPFPTPVYVAAERLHELRAVLPHADVIGDTPKLAEPPSFEVALHEILRSRLELCGPVTAAELAAPLGLDRGPVDIALLALEHQGSIMRGDFTARGLEEWCERRRLARIHRYTRDRKHAEIEPIVPVAFMRFLLDWQGLSGTERREGPAALEAVLRQLEGFPIAAAAWESEILIARLHDYDPAWLDALCASGRVVWQRLPSGAESTRKGSPVRSTPIVLLLREHLAHWQQPRENYAALSGIATSVVEALRAHGASFFSDLVADTGLLRSQVEVALGELVSAGLVTADGFAGLRALIAPADIKAKRLRRGGPLAAFQNIEGAGRWSLAEPRRRAGADTVSAEQRVREVPERPASASTSQRSDTVARAAADSASSEAQIEHIARVLLRRYGVVFRKLLERETRLPPWRDLFYVLRRLEARGEIRGGRFVSGFSGEQFALPEAANVLKRYREDRDEAVVTVSACDPLNLAGIIVPGIRVPAQPGNRVLFQGGRAVASRAGRQTRIAATTEMATQTVWRDRLIRRTQATRR